MRTTVNIDDDVLLAVRERARRENLSAGEVLSALLRLALTRSATSPRENGSDFLGFEPLPHRGPAVSNALIDRLREEIPEA